MLRKVPFVTVEGVDGAGKSSQLPVILKKLQQAGFDVVQTREPGGTPLGELLREQILNGQHEMNPNTQALLAFASRSEHVEQVIRPALDQGKAVLSDRFTDSTFAYQVGGGGASKPLVEALEREVQQGLQPDITFIFDLPVEESFARMHREARNLDNFESKPKQYFEQVRKGFLDRKKANPARVVIIDASVSKYEVSSQVEAALDDFLQRWALREGTSPNQKRPSP